MTVLDKNQRRYLRKIRQVIFHLFLATLILLQPLAPLSLVIPAHADDTATESAVVATTSATIATPSPSPSPSEDPSPSPIITPSPTASPSATPSPTPSDSPSPTPSPSLSPIPSATSSATPTPSPSPLGEVLGAITPPPIVPPLPLPAVVPPHFFHHFAGLTKTDFGNLTRLYGKHRHLVSTSFNGNAPAELNFGSDPTLDPSHIHIKNHLGKNIELVTTEVKNADDSTSLLLSPTGTFRPGDYTLSVTDGSGNTTTQDFTWGVLTINTDKDTYLPGDTAYLQMASLDENGQTLCDSNLELTVTDGTTTNTPTVQKSTTCGVNNVTDNPDYYAYYKTNKSGTYQLSLKNLDTGYAVTDFFTVGNSTPFTISRSGATRINPFSSTYTMHISVTAHQEYEGNVTETVPAGFTVVGNQPLTWPVHLKAGETKELSYEYQAPKVTPQIFLLGPAQLGTYQENRQWQLASDAACASAASGSWNVGATWTSCGVNGPVAGDTVTIGVGHMITIPTGVAAAAASITITGNSSATQNGLTFATSTSTLALTSSITTSAASNASGTLIAVDAGTLTGATTLAIAGSVTASQNTIFRISTGSATFSGNVTFSGTAAEAQFTFTGGGTLNVGGNFGSGGTLTGSTGTINVNGGLAQTLGIYTTYFNVTINNTSGGVTLLGTTTFGGALNVNAGTFTVGAFALTVTGTTTVSGTLTISSATGTKAFNGDITVNNGGTWNVTAVVTFTIPGSITSNGTFTSGTGVYTLSGTTKTLAGTTLAIASAAITGTYTNNGTFTVATALSGAGGLTNSATGTLVLSGTSTITTLTATASGNTVNYNKAGAQTVFNVNYYNLQLSGSAAKTLQTSTTAIGGTLTTSGTATVALVVGLAITGGLTIGTGTTFTAGAFALTVTGTTSITGTLTISSATGTKAINGDLTVNTGGSWNVTTAVTFTLPGSISNSGTFTASTGVYTLSGTTKTIAGTLTIASVAVTGTYTNNGTLTVSTALSGAGGLTNSGTGVLNLGGTSTITTLTVSAASNTVNYTGAAQTVFNVNYQNLGFSGSGAKTLQTGTTSVGGNLITSGTCTVALVVGLGITGNLTVGSGTTFTAGAFALTVTGTTSVSGTFTISSATGTKALNGDVTLNSGGTWNNTAANVALTLPGNWTNNGITFNAGTGIYTFSGTSMTFTGTTSFPSLTISGTYTNNGTLTVTTALAGAGTLTNGGSGTLNINFTGTPGISNLNVATAGNTVSYGFAGTQTIMALSYQNLTLAGSNIKTLTSLTTVSGNFTTSGTATATTAANLTVGGNLTIGTGTTFTTGANFTLGVTGTTSVTGTLANTNTGAKTYTGLVTINSGGSWTNATNSNIEFQGGFTNNSAGTVTFGTGVMTFDTNAQNIGGTNAISMANMTVNGVTLTNQSTVGLTITTALAGTGTLSQFTSAFLTLGGTSAISAFNATAASNLVTYNSTTAGQTIFSTEYHDLTISKSGQTGTLGGAITVDGNLTISAGTLDTSSGNNYGITLLGNWSNSGTFTARSGTITFAGADSSTQVITGNTSFFNFTASTSGNTVGRTIQFTGLSTTTVTGTWTITGASGKVITLASTNASVWTINPTAASVTFVSVSQSTNSGSSFCASFSTNGGTNTGWQISAGASCNTAPNTATSLIQETTGNVSIGTGAWTNSTSVKFAATVTDPDPSDTLQLCVEKDDINTAFTNTEDLCGSGVAYSGSGVSATVTISGITDATQYHWQARVKDAAGAYSSWVSYGGNSDTTPGAAADFGIDTTAPTGGTVYDGTNAGVDASFSTNSLSALSANWAGFNSNASGLARYDYAIGTTVGGTDILNWTSNGTSTSVTASGLTLKTSTVYYTSVRAVDNAGNVGTGVSSDGQIIQPSLSFSVSSPTVTFNNLNAGNSYNDTQTATLTTSTNAYNGYVIRAYVTDYLRSTDGATTIPDFNGGTYASPATWASGNRGLGYTSSDTSIQGSNKFSSGTLYAPFNHTGPGDIVADDTTNTSGTPITNEQFTMTYQVKTDATQAAKTYKTTVVYTATAQY